MDAPRRQSPTPLSAPSPGFVSATLPDQSADRARRQTVLSLVLSPATKTSVSQHSSHVGRAPPPRSTHPPPFQILTRSLLARQRASQPVRPGGAGSSPRRAPGQPRDPLSALPVTERRVSWSGLDAPVLRSTGKTEQDVGREDLETFHMMDPPICVDPDPGARCESSLLLPVKSSKGCLVATGARILS